MTFLPKFNLFTEPKAEGLNIKPEIEKIIKNQKGSYSVYYADFKSDSSFGINDKQIYTAASINKIPIVAGLYFLAEKGKVGLDEKIVLQKEDIQAYGTGSLQYEDPGSTYSLRTLAKLSLKQSDNTAAYLIATKIGMDQIQELVNKWGLTQTDMNNNKTSVHDTYLLMKKIYKGDIASKANTTELLNFMTDTDFEDRLPLLLGDKIKVYHKTGDAIGSIHDIGIIEKDNMVFFIGVMTSDVGDHEAETKKIIGEIAKKILDFKVEQKN